ncbi:hypothetical protein D0Z03_000623 [Geotrichum reessii]|nr:hypothetical protein D0Z03_000623 [Galactomyces reessii]
MTLGPSYRSELISSKSNDKNGTLVTGLQAKHKQLIRMLAFLELAHIAINVKARRQIIPNPSLTIVGVSALAALVCHSIEDDQYGMVQKDIANILERLVDAHSMLSKFVDSPPVHWSNPREKVDSKRDLTDILNVLDAVDDAFTNIVHEFYDYLPSLGLSPKIIDVINKRLD